ncbi:MAG: hypothetical protein ACRER2_09385 [Methylococcales bacterium]
MLLSSAWLIGCTSLESHLSIEPYTQIKPMRDALEHLAESYCRKKRAALPVDSTRMPDYIFTTDGCTRSPDGSWSTCCIAHDIAYWCGGGEQDRKAADQELSHCMNEKLPPLGTLYYAVVRIGGVPWLPSPWRWGYGWARWPANYEENTSSPSVHELLDQLKVYQLIEGHFSSGQP